MEYELPKPILPQKKIHKMALITAQTLAENLDMRKLCARFIL
jgi:hypothetical protein